MAGFYVFDFPDVSTIDHVHRLATNIPSQTMPGGNCLFLLLDQVDGYFPYIYNEDWIYVLHNGSRRLGSALGEATQTPHAPWREQGRAGFEEFGETIVCGLLDLDQVLDAPDALSEAYWTEVMRLRRNFLKCTRDACTTTELRTVVEDALQMLSRFSPQDCARFVAAMKTELADHLWLQNILKTV